LPLRTIPLLLAAALAIALTGPTAARAVDPPPGCTGADVAPTAQSAARARAAIACLLDAERDRRGLPALRRDPHLRAVAQSFARRLDPKRPLSHTGADASTTVERVADAGYTRGPFTASETLGRGDGRLATPSALVATWLASASTRRTLLSGRYRDVGVGVVVRGPVVTYVVELARRTAAISS
jgi:uncharacterized protein YkwD